MAIPPPPPPPLLPITPFRPRATASGAQGGFYCPLPPPLAPSCAPPSPQPCALQVLPQQCHKVGVPLPTGKDSGALTRPLYNALRSKSRDVGDGDTDGESSARGASTTASPITPAEAASGAFPSPRDGDGEWPFLALGRHNLFKMLQRFPRRTLELTAAAYVTSGDVCATLYASSPAMLSGLLRQFAGDQVNAAAKSNLRIGLERFSNNVLSDGDRQRGIETLLGRPRDPLPKPPSIGYEQASRCVLLMSDSNLERDCVQVRVARGQGCG